MTFDQRGDLAVVGPEQEISLPVARHGTVFSFGRPFAD
jgi:hypothetical protein